jgi:hypothetical protein
MVPVIPAAALAIAATVGAKWAVREWRRINEELDRVQPKREHRDRETRDLPRLKRDPKTGEWRPG